MEHELRHTTSSGKCSHVGLWRDVATGWLASGSLEPKRHDDRFLLWDGHLCVTYRSRANAMANGIGALCHCLVCRDLSSCWYCTYLQLCKQNRQGYRGKWAGRQLRFGIRGNGDRFVMPMVLLASRILYSRYRMFVNWRHVLVCIERRYRYRTCEKYT